MIIKSSMFRARIAEVPITLHRDGRKSHPSHLKTFRDGWSTLRFFLLSCPRWLFYYPGLLLIVLGLIGYVVAMKGLTILGLTFDAHTLLFASLAILCGYQAVVFAISAKAFAVGEGLLPEDARLKRFCEVVNLERGMLAGATAFLVGLILLGCAIVQWWETNFGNLDYARTMRWVIPGMTLTALGFQTILSRSFISILQMRRK